MPRSFRFVAGVMTVGLCVGIGIPAGRAVEQMAIPLRLPAGGVGSALGARLSEGLSVRRVAGDRAWIDLLLYAGDSSFALDRGGKLVTLARRASGHDPTFREVYFFAGAMLMWQCDRPQEAADLLRRGIEANPANDRLKMYLAAFTYSRLKDLGGEIRVLERLAREPGAPFILKRILANAWEARAKAERDPKRRRAAFNRAVSIWGQVWLTSDVPEERRWVEIKCGRIGLDPHQFEKAEK